MSLLIKKRCCCGYTPKDIYQYSEDGTYPRKHWFTGSGYYSRVTGIAGLSDGGCIIKVDEPNANWRGADGHSANAWRLDDNAEVVWYKTISGSWGTADGEGFWLYVHSGDDTLLKKYNNSGVLVDSYTLTDRKINRMSISGNTHFFSENLPYKWKYTYHWIYRHALVISKYVNKVFSWEGTLGHCGSWPGDYGQLSNDGTNAYMSVVHYGDPPFYDSGIKILKRTSSQWAWERYNIHNGDGGAANSIYFNGVLLSVNGGYSNDWDQGDPADDANLFVINPSDGAVSHHDLLPPGEVCPECSRGEAVTDGSYAWVTDGYHVDGDGEGVLTMIRKINSSGVTSKRWLLESGYEWPNQIGRGGGRLWIATW